MGDYKIEEEILPNFKVEVVFVINEHSGKKIPTITDVIHNKISIFDIIKENIIFDIRSKIFKQTNGYG